MTTEQIEFLLKITYQCLDDVREIVGEDYAPNEFFGVIDALERLKSGEYVIVERPDNW